MALDKLLWRRKICHRRCSIIRRRKSCAHGLEGESQFFAPATERLVGREVLNRLRSRTGHMACIELYPKV